ncbi:ROK family protein [Rhodococcus sp. 3Y1]
MDTVAGVVAPINITEWAQGFELVAGVRSVFPDAGTALAMDGAAAALAEFHHGAGRGTPNLLSLVVSTGIGGGIVLGGEIARVARERRSHRPSRRSRICRTVQLRGVGRLETVASGPSAVRWARSQGWSGNTGRELAEGARSGDAIAVDALHRAGTALGGAIASAAALLDVDLAVIGGGFAQSGTPLWEPMLDAAARHARLSFVAGLRIVPAELGGAGTLTGAGLLALTAVI